MGKQKILHQQDWLSAWYDQVDKSGFMSFGTIARVIQAPYLNIINFFDDDQSTQQVNLSMQRLKHLGLHSEA